MAYKYQNRPIYLNQAFTLNGILYPANWLQKATASDLEKVGITYEPDLPRADDKYYWNGNVNSPKPLEDSEGVQGLKSRLIEEIKDICNRTLKHTDWYVVRKMEKGLPIPVEVDAKRNHARNECNRLEQAIKNVNTVEELIVVVKTQNWSNDVTA